MVENHYTFFEGKLFDKYTQPDEYVDKKLDMEPYVFRWWRCTAIPTNGTPGKNQAYLFQTLADALDAINGPFSGNDEEVYPVGVTIAYNILRHFYPNFDVMEVDCDQQLTIALRSALMDKDKKVCKKGARQE